MLKLEWPLGILTLASAYGPSVAAGWPTIITSRSILLAVSLSMAAGLFFGLYPANGTARLNPIAALRYE
ncbi:MAG: ABC transporter permease [Nitrospira sp. CG24A]|nr:MAG: ABC transporter permease [Nitrospira sp. CG24A]